MSSHATQVGQGTGKVFPKRPRSKQDISIALNAAWSRCILAMGGRGTFADRTGTTDKTVSNALKGPGLPEADTLLNSLCADVTALDEVLKLYGLRATPCSSDDCDDMKLVSRLSDAGAEYLRRMLDGKRCHIDTAVLAKVFRPLMPEMQAIIDEADRLAGISA